MLFNNNTNTSSKMKKQEILDTLESLLQSESTEYSVEDKEKLQTIFNNISKTNKRKQIFDYLVEIAKVVSGFSGFT